MTYFDLFDSPLGEMLVTSDGEAITGLFFESHKGGPRVPPSWQRDPGRFDVLRSQIGEYFAGSRTQFDLPLNLEGTEFQRSVWDQLLTIGFGNTISYGEIATRLGAPNASRAVGAAVGKNPVSIIVPCHRVVGGNGSITGYAGGLDRKRRLLDLESANQLALL